ncbi:hypothetical protein GOP47_0006980 [Adiantum capillus-veneris]|uniref:Uncharacterized protein n=1 Tax=Adiantum capillus-veneris TaxID=13818 RepID=A0A9D4ZL33_ADICA|nr:hypothetical protein GOP47_0006980 [Adiantum capillus-veneris]
MMNGTSSAAGVAARPLIFNKAPVSLWSHHAWRAHWPPSLLPFSLSLAASPFKNNAGAGLDVPEGVTMVMEARDNFAEVGVICSTHGIKGELKVMFLTDIPEQQFDRPGIRRVGFYRMGKLVGLRKIKILCGRKIIQGKDSAWLLTFEDVDSKEKASELVGTILVKDADRPVFNAHQFYIPELIGRSVQMKVNALITDEEKEILRRQRISLANKGRIPWNKGGNGKKQVKAFITDEEKENLRRQRISQANKGKVPWNKGGKHSSETKKRIRAGVIERMKDPKIREKLRLQAEAVQLSPEVKMKIRTGIIKAWVAKKKLRVKQELCLLEWREVIAETARRGSDGDLEYQWNSFSMLRKQPREAVPREKREPNPRPDNLSAEHRLRISAAIKAKWSNPDYRISVEKGIRNAVSKRIPISSQGRTRTQPRRTFSRALQRSTTPHTSHISGEKATQKSAPKGCTPRKRLSSSDNIENPAIVRHAVHSVKGDLRADIMEVGSPSPNADVPCYKDPEAEKKLEKLKSMRSRRMHLEAQKQKEITARARALISQAQEAAKALEAVAVKDKAALAPLLETQKLLAEAVHSLQCLNRKSSTSDYTVKDDDSALYAQVMRLANAVSSPVGNANNHPKPESISVESSNLRSVNGGD